MSVAESDGSRLVGCWLLLLPRAAVLVLPLEGRFTCVAFVERAGERDAGFAADRAVAAEVLVLGDVVAVFPDPVRVLAVRAAAFFVVPAAVRSVLWAALRLPVAAFLAVPRAAAVRPAAVAFLAGLRAAAAFERVLAAAVDLPVAAFFADADFAFAVLVAFFLAGLFTDAMSAAPGSL